MEKWPSVSFSLLVFLSAGLLAARRQQPGRQNQHNTCSVPGVAQSLVPPMPHHFLTNFPPSSPYHSTIRESYLHLLISLLSSVTPPAIFNPVCLICAVSFQPLAINCPLPPLLLFTPSFLAVSSPLISSFSFFSSSFPLREVSACFTSRLLCLALSN